MVVTAAWAWRRGARLPLTKLSDSRHRGLGWIAWLPVGLMILCGVVGSLAPSNASDWDTIAYHLAVPKVWLTSGNLAPISFVHHSFFPATIDALFALGLQWGGQSGAKSFTLVYSISGALAIWGLARDRYGSAAANWAVAIFATIPVAVWETGTGYIDVAHGLYAGLGVWLVLEGLDRTESSTTILGGLLLGLAAGSKYTGLQALIATGIVVGFLALRRREARKASVLLAAGLAVLVAAPWYVRNAMVAGNPVYPFFYERLGGKWWSPHQAEIYRYEQKTFGVPSDPPLSIPHAILGLAYQPGRYINPGQKLEVVEGKPRGATGNELGAVGPVLGCALLVGLAYHRRLKGGSSWLAPSVLAWVMLGLLMWALLSQQSRYMLSFAPPLAILAGGLFASTGFPRWIMVGGGILVAVQGGWTALLAKDRLLSQDRMRVALGVIPEQDYLRQTLAFYEAAEYLNEQRAKRVALFDEVFGYYLDVPYFWAGYGHTNEMDYEHLHDAAGFVAKLRSLGIDRVYVSLAFSDRAFVERWVAAMGIQGTQEPLVDEERQRLLGSLEGKWKVFLADAVASGDLTPERAFRGGLLFRLSD